MKKTSKSRPYTREQLTRDMRALGIEPGDLLFVHSSFKSLGPVQGGANAVIAAIEDVVGQDGLILMPSFNLLAKDRKATWNIETAPSTVGWLTEYFRRMEGTFRSDHFSHSVAARGKGAEEFVKGHLSREGWKCDKDINSEPWGYAYGFHSPMYKAYERGGKMLFIGTGYQTATYLHVVEARYATEYLKKDPAAGYDMIFRPAAGAYWESLGRVKHGKIGDADCRLFGIRDFVDTIHNAVRERPHRFLNVWEPKPKGIRRVTVDGHSIVHEDDAGVVGSPSPGLTRQGDGSVAIAFPCGGRVMRRRSTDGGTTWHPENSPPPSDIGGASDEAVLSDGQILIVYKTPPPASPTIAARIVENDRGEFNQAPEFVITGDLAMRDVGAPCAVECAPGRVLVGFWGDTTSRRRVIAVCRLRLY